MSSHRDETGQIEAVLALYWAVIGTAAAINYLTGWHALADGLGLGSTALTAVYGLWFLTLVRGIPGNLEVAFGGR